MPMLIVWVGSGKAGVWLVLSQRVKQDHKWEKNEPELRDGNDIQPVRKWSPVEVWKVAQEGVMNGVGAWQGRECRMPPAQCRVTWFLKSSRGGSGSPPPLSNSKNPLFSFRWISLYTSGMFVGFFWGVGGRDED